MTLPLMEGQPKLMWSPKAPKNTQMCKFRNYVNQKHQLNLSDYFALHQWSVDNISLFWQDVWEYTNIISSESFDKVVDETAKMSEIPTWFEGARLNYAENVLRRKDNKIALISTDEFGVIKKMTFAELYLNVAKCSHALRQMGVTKGDRVAGYIANCPETVIAALATASIGAFWSSASPDFGILGVIDRFGQLEPKVLFTLNAVVYNGKVHSHLGKVKELISTINFEKVVVVNYCENAPFEMFDKCVSYNEFIDNDAKDIVFEQLPFNHPLFIMFSSGTTGKPKCIVHSAGGTLIQHCKEHIIHGDLNEEDVFFQYTTSGWMMWNWMLTGLYTGATLVLFDGSPFKPNEYVLWDLVDRLKITVFGTSAKYIQSLEAVKARPVDHQSLSSLRMILSTGSPLSPENYDYIYTCVKQDVLLGSITGGTDIISLFASHNCELPVYRGEIQCSGLGMKMEAFNEKGESMFGKTGDLVCTKPFPCMPVYFLNDEKKEKYHGAYFSVFEDIWHHGDFVYINPSTKGLVMLGRSDGTLNPAGVRFGSAELYNIVVKFSEVEDCLAVGQKQGTDERVVLFLKMKEGQTFTPALSQNIKTKIRNELSPRHVPAFVLPTPAIPYTINGKKMEVLIKRIISGEKVIPSATLANPECLEYYYNIPELNK